MKGLDCTSLRCPEFTVPVLRMINEHKSNGEELVLKTLEPRAPKRIQHLCASYDWELLAVAQSDNVIFIKIKC